MLVDYYLRNKIMDELIDYCLIEEVHNVYAIHSQDLAGISQVQYFFTSHPFELQSTDVKGRWIAGVKEDIVFKDVKVVVLFQRIPSHPLELQSTDVKGRWIAGVKEDIVFKDVKVVVLFQRIP
ncbi:hypothetical protein IFM89_032669, partial [Coptis chinensis]